MLTLSLGCLFSDRIETLLDGRVSPEGCQLTVRVLEAQTLFRAVLRHAAYDLAELSMGSFVAAVAAGDRTYLGLPIFLSRSFRHANLYVRTDRIRRPEDLAGATIGLIDFQQTAALWLRGLLADDHGVVRSGVRWITAGLHAPLLSDRSKLAPPAGLSVTRSSGTLDDMLRTGAVDAVISPTAPRCFGDDAVPVDRMWPDFSTAETDWWRRTGVFPIMHLLVLRRELAEENPSLPEAMYAAFEKARSLAASDLADRDFPKVASPGQLAAAAAARATYGADLWSYGLDANRPALERMLRYAEADGLTRGGITPDDLFLARLGHSGEPA